MHLPACSSQAFCSGRTSSYIIDGLFYSLAPLLRQKRGASSKPIKLSMILPLSPSTLAKHVSGFVLQTITLNDMLYNIELTDTYKYRAFLQKTKKYTFLSGAHGSLSRIDHILGHKTDINTFKILSSITPNNSIKLETI